MSSYFVGIRTYKKFTVLTEKKDFFLGFGFVEHSVPGVMMRFGIFTIHFALGLCAGLCHA
jgi:hypothetical protein